MKKNWGGVKDTFPELFVNDRKRGKLNPFIGYWSIKEMLFRATVVK